jgi:hypothetical protein
MWCVNRNVSGGQAFLIFRAARTQKCRQDGRRETSVRAAGWQRQAEPSELADGLEVPTRTVIKRAPGAHLALQVMF